MLNSISDPTRVHKKDKRVDPIASMLSVNKRSAGQMSVGCPSNESPKPLKSRKLKLNSSFATSSVSSHSSAFSGPFRFITLSRRDTPSTSSIPILSPSTYLTYSLKNEKIKCRVDSFSIEQALYFEPYEESAIDIDILKALRGSDLEKLQFIVNDQERKHDLVARNQFGENLVHLACRVSTLKLNVLKFLVEDANVNLNVRDHLGRTPLHNACMSAAPNFNKIHYIMKKAPKLVIFEDDSHKIPFDLIPHTCFERWTRFLSEKKSLPKLCKELSKHEGLSQKG